MYDFGRHFYRSDLLFGLKFASRLYESTILRSRCFAGSVILAVLRRENANLDIAETHVFVRLEHDRQNFVQKPLFLFE